MKTWLIITLLVTTLTFSAILVYLGTKRSGPGSTSPGPKPPSCDGDTSTNPRAQLFEKYLKTKLQKAIR